MKKIRQKHSLGNVGETVEVKILWNVNNQWDHIIEAKRHDMIVMNESKRKCIIVDIFVSVDGRVSDKEKKVERYQGLKRKIKNISYMINVIVIVGEL